jgi:hypothetical protein
MKDLDFLNKPKKEKKLELVEQSEEMSKSYELKSKECRNVAKLTLDAQYYVTPIQANPTSKESAMNLLNLANKFVLELLAFKDNLKQETIKRLRENFNKM